MKIFTLVAALLFAGAASAQTLPPTETFSDSVGTLNQVTPQTTESGEKLMSTEGPQDQQERLYWEQKRREEKEWEKQKQIEDYRFDVPGP